MCRQHRTGRVHWKISMPKYPLSLAIYLRNWQANTWSAINCGGKTANFVILKNQTSPSLLQIWVPQQTIGMMTLRRWVAAATKRDALVLMSSTILANFFCLRLYIDINIAYNMRNTVSCVVYFSGVSGTTILGRKTVLMYQFLYWATVSKLLNCGRNIVFHLSVYCHSHHFKAIVDFYSKQAAEAVLSPSVVLAGSSKRWWL